MIEELKITNFQSHKNTHIKFSPGVNVIVGPSDSGKTTMMRALIWIIRNKPSGDSFKSTWENKGTEVSTKLKDVWISRKRGKKNCYTIEEKGSTTNLKAMGQAVPQEVEQLFNISDLNLQSQFDKPFLLDSSSGEVARYLNSVINLDTIHNSLNSIGKTIRKENWQITLEEETLQKKEEELLEYEWLDEADKRLAKVEKLVDINKKDRLNFVKLQDTTFVLLKHEKQLQATTPILKAEKKVNLLIEKNKQVKNIENKYEALSELVSEIKKVQEEINATLETVKQKKEEYNKLMPDVCPLCEQEIKKF